MQGEWHLWYSYSRGTNQPLLVNTTKAVEGCALDQENMYSYTQLYHVLYACVCVRLTSL